MHTKLIIIRGNSGSGKTTVAHNLQHRLGYGTMLVSQDVVRRQILRCKDTPGNPSVDLMESMVRFGWTQGYTVIVEGILQTSVSGDMLRKLVDECPGQSLVYYYRITFEETLRRHATKSNAHEFGEAEMRRWWLDDDKLAVDDEIIIDDKLTETEVIQQIYESAASPAGWG